MLDGVVPTHPDNLTYIPIPFRHYSSGTTLVPLQRNKAIPAAVTICKAA